MRKVLRKMMKVLIALKIIMNHLLNNISNYLLFIGICLILNYIKNKYGTDTALLGVGIVLILTSLVNELNKLPKTQQRRY